MPVIDGIKQPKIGQKRQILILEPKKKGENGENETLVRFSFPFSLLLNGFIRI